MKEIKKRRNAVARIAAAENKSDAIAAEAKRAGVSTRTVERWVEAAKASPAVGQPGTSENAVPTGKTPENPVLDDLLKSEGAPETEASGPPTPTEIAAAGADAESFCVDTYSGVRSAVGAVLVSMRYSPPLDATSPEVLKLLKVTMAAELAIRANAPRIYPILVKYASGWGALIFAVGADALGLVIGLESLAKSRGWVPAPKDERSRPAAAAVPSPRSYGESLRTTPEAEPAAPAPKGQETVVDAPLPTEEQVAAAAMVRQVVTG